MVRWKNKEYSGKIMRNDNEVLSVVVYTSDGFEDVSASLNGVTEVVEWTTEEDVSTYSVVAPKSSKIISANTYYIEFSTQQPLIKQLEDRIHEQNDVIDALLIAILEG